MSKKRALGTVLIKRIVSVLMLFGFLLSICSCSKPSASEGSADASGLKDGRFGSVRHITVGVDDHFGRLRNDDENSEEKVDLNSSLLAIYIHDAVLEECNIDVEFVGLNGRNVCNGNMPDISLVADVNNLNTYYRMNAIVNVAPYIEGNSAELGSLFELLGEENIYSGTDDRSEVWYLKVKENRPVANVTFIRTDWLEKLDLEVPSTRAEFENCLKEFRANADYLLGDDASMMIPFLIDNEPHNSAKPLFDSFFDPSMDDKDCYAHGYDHSTMPGYGDCLRLLNEWYLADLIPSDYGSIGRYTKEYYEPIENGFVGAFCASYDYLYCGAEPHIDVLHEKCGEQADYIAVNTFENSEGEYTYWHADYSDMNQKQIFLPSTCTEPLACLVYLNWISTPSTMQEIEHLWLNSTVSDDPYSYERFLITTDCESDAELLASKPAAGLAKETAEEVTIISRGSKCVRYGPDYLKYCSSDLDFDAVYPDSLRKYNTSMISSPECEFDSLYSVTLEEYLLSGAGYIYSMRLSEWDKVMVQGDMTPW